MLTVEGVMNFLNEKGGASDPQEFKKDAESFLEYLRNNNVTSYEGITDDHYYDWIDSKV